MRVIGYTARFDPNIMAHKKTSLFMQGGFLLETIDEGDFVSASWAIASMTGLHRH